MAKIPEDVKKAIAEIKPALVATAGKDGLPNVSPKGSFRVLDDEHVVFADLRSPRTIANIKENPKVAVIGIEPVSRKGWRIRGQAEVLTGGAIFDSFTQEYASKGKVNHVVKLKVEEAATF
ncbi:MAG: pyridoxamine 5'-phosphate oxidase family protein [Syntrophales bacterium]|nr:pyridoxamine 5'-phosphate oxidase family protein [Syntrophales bacterium]